MAPELHSIYDLTTFCRKTTGDVPAKLVGASTTVVGSKMYLFGGRLVTERRMVADLYVFDLETYVWAKIPPFPEDDVPRARYFHSVDTWNNQLIVFGGMSNEPDSPNPDELCVLNDVRFFDIASRHWLPPSRLPTPENLLPRARYAQLSSVTGDRLFIIGGQDFYNTWLDDVCVYDLLAKTWSEKRDYPRHCGSYRSVAVSSTQVVRFPKEEMRVASALGPAGTRFQNGDASPPEDVTPSESLNHLPYSAPPNDEHPSDIYLYSNYNFTDVKRELEIFSPLPDTGFTIEDRSAAMSGTTFPPGLRFPTGAILGTHLIIAGIYLAHSYQSFSIWVLDLQTMVWSRIDPGKAVETGSWFRGCLWPEANKFMIFGNRAGNLVDDYNRRLLSWDHVAVVDLEAFGIYQPPALKLELPMQELGLAALEERVLADFEIICDDGRTLSCSRKLLEDRWPWFKEQRLKLLQSAMGALEGLPNSPMHAPLPALPGTATADRPDPRLTPRALNLSEAYPVALALIQYFYTLALLTPLQTAPAVLSQLLVLSTNYKIPHLQSLVQHAMHRALSNSTSVGVYEVATLCSCRSLQIRALKTVMSYTQKKPSKSRPERAGGGGGGGSGDGGGGGASNRDGGGGGGAEPKYPTRPRGTSDARWAQMGSPDNGARGYGGYNNGGTQRVPMARMLMDDGEQFFTLPPTVKHYAHARSDSQIHRRPRADRHSPAHLVPPAMEDDDDLDELFTLPVSIKEKRLQLQRRHIEEAQKQLSPPQLNRATSRASVVSLHTENELHELMEMIAPPVPSSAIPDVPQRQISDQQIMDELYESLRASSLSTPNPSDMSDAEDSYPSSSRASATYESEYESDAMPTSLGGFSYHLPRRRTEVRGSLSLSLSPSMAPSLSSASSSSSSQADSARPRTPLSQDGHGPFALPIIQERYPDGDADDVDERRQFLDARAARPWPKQKSKVEWLPPQTVEEEQITIQPRVAVTEKRGPNVRVVTDAGKRATSPTPSSETVSPRAITTSFTRMLTRKRSPSDATKSPVSIASSKSPVSPASSQFFDKAQKAEEKRRKKEASKARTEELARTLKERTRQAREDAERMSLRSKERNKEPPAMYGGVADGLTL